MQANPNRSYSNPPLRELNSISMTQKIPSTLKSPQEFSQTRPKKNLEISFELTEKKLGGVEGDRAALIYRINKLQQVVDGLNKENSELHSKVHHEKARLDDISKKIVHTAKVKNLVDRNNKGDLAYEREENARIKHLLHSLEAERNGLRVRVKELEGVNAGGSYEKQEILMKLQQKSDHVMIIEGDNRILVDKLALLQGKLQVFERENGLVCKENENLKGILMEFEEKYEEMRRGLQEEGGKYNNLVMAKRDELENIKWAFRRQVRVVAARNTATEMEKIVGLRMQNAFFHLKMLGESQKCRKTSENLVGKRYEGQILRKIVKVWKKITGEAVNQTTGRLKSVKNIGNLLVNREKTSVQHAYTRWKRSCMFLKLRNKLLFRLIALNSTETLRFVIKKWNSQSKTSKFLQNIEDLSVDFAAHCTKAKVFYNFKEYIKVKQANLHNKSLQNVIAQKLYKGNLINELKRTTLNQKRKRLYLKKIVSKAQGKYINSAMQTWKFRIFSEKNTSKMKSLLGFALGKKQKIFEKSIFSAWKSYQNKAKLKKIQENLNKETNARTHLESNFSDLGQNYSKALQTLSIKALINPLFRSLKSNFSHWKSFTKYFKNSLPSVRTLIFKRYFLKAFSAFSAWKLKKSQFEYCALNYKNEKILKEKIEIHQNVLMLEEILADKHKSIEKIKESLIKKCVFTMKNKDLAAALRKWGKVSMILKQKDNGIELLKETLRKVIFNKGFLKIREFVKEKNLKMIRKRRLAKGFLSKCRGSLILCFDGWKHYVWTLKRFRKTASATLAKRDLANLAISIKSWIDFVSSSEIVRLNRAAKLLAQEKSEIENNLLSISMNLADEQKTLISLQIHSQKQSKKKLIISLFNGANRKVHSALMKWKNLNAFSKVLQKKTKKIISCWITKETRSAWRTWNSFIKGQIHSWASGEIIMHKKEKKNLQIESKKILKEKDLEIAFSVEKTAEFEKKYEKTLKIRDFLLNRGLRETSDEYSISKASYCFDIMKQRYYRLKSVLEAFARSVKQLNIRRGLRDIKGYYVESLKITSLRIMLVSVFKRFGARLMRNEFDRWCRNISFIFGKKQEKVIRDSGKAVAMAASHEQMVKKWNRAKACKVLIGKNKRCLFVAWQKAAKTAKTVKSATLAFKVLTKSTRQAFVLTTLSRHVREKKLTRRNFLKSQTKSSQNILKSNFSQWKFMYTSHKTLTKSLRKVVHIYGILSKTHFFSILKQSFLASSLKNSFLAQSKISILKRMLLSESKRTNLKFLEKWKSGNLNKKSAFKILKTAILRAFHSKLRNGFSLWNEEILLKDTVDITNSQGPVAIENGILKGRIEILNRLMEEEGLDMQYVEKYILEKENLQSALALQAIHRYKYKSGQTNPNDCSVIPKFFIIWKKWVLRRQRILKVSYRLQAYTRKSDLMHGFLKWKHGLSLIINTVNKLPRRDLFSLIAKLDMDLKFLESKLQSTHKSYLYYETYSQILSVQVRKGQNMALVSCALQTHKALHQALLRWTYHSGLCKVHELLEQLTSTEQNLYIYKTTLKTIEDDNQLLIEENMELRQASLDGVAIAEAFETLSKERERLSLDLADRTATIKRLIDQNNELAERLRNVGYEPEKENLKSKRYN